MPDQAPAAPVDAARRAEETVATIGSGVGESLVDQLRASEPAAETTPAPAKKRRLAHLETVPAVSGGNGRTACRDSHAGDGQSPRGQSSPRSSVCCDARPTGAGLQFNNADSTPGRGPGEERSAARTCRC